MLIFTHLPDSGCECEVKIISPVSFKRIAQIEQYRVYQFDAAPFYCCLWPFHALLPAASLSCHLYSNDFVIPIKETKCIIEEKRDGAQKVTARSRYNNGTEWYEPICNCDLDTRRRNTRAPIQWCVRLFCCDQNANENNKKSEAEIVDNSHSCNRHTAPIERVYNRNRWVGRTLSMARHTNVSTSENRIVSHSPDNVKLSAASVLTYRHSPSMLHRVCVCPSPSICGALQLLCASHWRFIEKSSICMRDEVVRAPLSSYRWNSLFFGIRFYLYFSSSHCVCGRCECVRVSVWLCVGETDSILFRLAATDSAIRIRLMLNTFSGVVVHMSFASPIRFLFYCYLFRVSYRAT